MLWKDTQSLRIGFLENGLAYATVLDTNGFSVMDNPIHAVDPATYLTGPPVVLPDSTIVFLSAVDPPSTSASYTRFTRIDVMGNVLADTTINESGMNGQLGTNLVYHKGALFTVQEFDGRTNSPGNWSCKNSASTETFCGTATNTMV